MINKKVNDVYNIKRYVSIMTSDIAYLKVT